MLSVTLSVDIDNRSVMPRHINFTNLLIFMLTDGVNTLFMIRNHTYLRNSLFSKNAPSSVTLSVDFSNRSKGPM
jgi:hypothetical protein